MSIFGALQSGISGLAAQSSAMGAISDNIANVNTVGYKTTNNNFQTLVTKQTSSSLYSPGGVQSRPKQAVSAQGLLASTSSSTDVAISGSGFFVVNQAANPGEGDMWAYTRAGSFGLDDDGYLKNTGGFYAQGWSLLPWDGNPNASVVNVGGINYMKAYYDQSGKTVYINDNIIDSRNLRPINLSTIGGTATPTQQISLGANLPSGAPIYDPSNADAGGKEKLSALIYDSLGNAHNMSLEYTKTSANGWSMGSTMPSGAASLVMTGNTENSKDLSADVYYAAGQLEFSSIPQNGSTISITDAGTGQTYTFEFVNNAAGYTGTNIPVEISDQVVSVDDFVKNFEIALKANMPSAGRFTADGNKISIVQSTAGSALTIDASKTLSCLQSAANPREDTGIPSGIFTVPQIDDDIKNCARIDFNSTNATHYNGKTISIGGQTYTFTDTPAVPANPNEVDIRGALLAGGKIDPAKLVSALETTLKNTANEPNRFVASGMTLEIYPTSSGGDIAIDTTDLGTAIDGTIRVKDGSWDSIQNKNLVLGNTFKTNTTEVQEGSIVAAVRFNSDGTPKQFYVDSMSIEWANGAENMNGATGQGTPISLKMGNVGTNDGLTNLSGNFTTNYIKQDGAKFGSYAGVNIDENGVVTALFDNGETRPIAILPLATFANAEGLESLTGNSWIETDYSGQALLKQAGTNGAGEITGYALEQSKTDLATEFSNMIVTQRAYSAATKIITTADEMLDELTRMT